MVILYRTTEGAWGGGNSFLRSLRRLWERQGIQVVDRVEAGAAGVLVNSAYLGAIGRNTLLTPEMAARLVATGYLNPLPAAFGLSQWRRKGQRPPFVHRLDGVFRLYGRNAGDPADVAQPGINRFMDYTVFQSEFCRESFRNEGLDVTRSTVIFNGVDTQRFFPANQPPLSPFRLIMVSWSNNPNKGAAYAIQAAELRDTEVTFVGRWPAGLSSGNVKVVPPQTHEALPHLLREHHALIHMALNEPCSNAILEGMASGLPVIYHPTGGSPELVGQAGVPGEPAFETAITRLREQYQDYRDRVLEQRDSVSIEKVGAAYLRVFTEMGLQRL